MRRMSFSLLVSCFLFSLSLLAQTQITTGVIQGTVMDSTGAVLPGVDVAIVNPRRTSRRAGPRDADGRFVFLQLPPGRYTATFRLSGFGTVVQENIDLTVGQAVNLTPRLAVGNVTETVTVSGTPVVETTRAAVATTLNRDDDRDHADPRAQVRRSADADAGRERRAGARRRRDHVCRPARRVQQHQPRRRRLQQRILRRAGRRAARADRHHARRGEGVPGDRQRRASRVRPHRRRRRQRHHEVGHQRAPRLGVPLPAARGADERPVGRHDAGKFPSRAVRRHASAGRSGATRVLLRRVRGHHG